MLAATATRHTPLKSLATGQNFVNAPPVKVNYLKPPAVGLYNDKDEKVGKVDDIIIAPDKAVSYAIVGAGGFLGVGKHDVAIPVNQFKAMDGKLVLAGASKGALKAMPEFEYAH